MLNISSPELLQASFDKPLELSPAGIVASNFVLRVLETVMATEGIYQDLTGENHSGFNNLTSRLKTVAGIWRSGDLLEHYAKYVDTRVEYVDPDTGLMFEADIPKVRTCYMRPNHYDTRRSGSHEDRTPIGNIVSDTGGDELSQALRKIENQMDLQLVGTRPRKFEDFSDITNERKEIDTYVYNSLPKGLIDPYAAIRKSKGNKYNMMIRSAYDEAYLKAITSGDIKKADLDSIVLRAAILAMTPDNINLRNKIQRILPKFISGLIDMSIYDVQVGYHSHIRIPAENILAKYKLQH